MLSFGRKLNAKVLCLPISAYFIEFAPQMAGCD